MTTPETADHIGDGMIDHPPECVCTPIGPYDGHSGVVAHHSGPPPIWINAACPVHGHKAAPASQTDAVAETTPCALMGEAMARYKHGEITAAEAVNIILGQAKRLSTPLPELSGNPGTLNGEVVAWRYRLIGTAGWVHAGEDSARSVAEAILRPSMYEVQALGVLSAPPHEARDAPEGGA